MARKLISTKGMPVDVWRTWRNNGVGGSDIAAILGFNKYRNIVSVWLEKTGQMPSGEDNFKMEMGRRLEPVVADMFAERNPDLKIRKNNYLLQHDTIDCMLANVDREVICPKRGRGILEIKTTGAYLKQEWTSDTVPDMYMCQLQWYLAVTGYNFGYFAVLIGGNEDFKTYYVERNERIIANLESKAVEFWELVTSMTVPDIDGTDASAEALKILYPPDRTSVDEVYFGLDTESLAMELYEIKQQEKALEARKQALENEFKSRLGIAQQGRIGAYTVKWAFTAGRSGIDTDKLKTDFPEIYEECAKVGKPSRRFSINFKENE